VKAKSGGSFFHRVSDVMSEQHTTDFSRKNSAVNNRTG